jgi:hypothetical protein
MVLVGLVIAWRFAESPILRSPFCKNATTEGVVLLPSSLAITTGSLPSITETQELVVPKSIPIIFPIVMFVLKVTIQKPPRPSGTPPFVGESFGLLDTINVRAFRFWCCFGRQNFSLCRNGRKNCNKTDDKMA